LVGSLSGIFYFASNGPFLRLQMRAMRIGQRLQDDQPEPQVLAAVFGEMGDSLTSVKVSFLQHIFRVDAAAQGGMEAKVDQSPKSLSMFQQSVGNAGRVGH
jgi:hypothetical protein